MLLLLINHLQNIKLDYPSNFPSLAKDLVSKILVKNPKSRLGLHEIKTHPWIKLNALNKKEKDPRKLIEEATFGQSMAQVKTIADVNEKIVGTALAFTQDEIIRFARPDSVRLLLIFFMIIDLNLSDNQF